jgi:DNA-binding CsgD family transcriptional regulator
VDTESDTVDLATLWTELCEGTRRVVDCGFSQSAFVLTVEYSPTPCPARPAHLDVLGSLLLGTHPMLIALDRAITLSSVGWMATQTLRAWGINPPKLQTAPVVLAVAAHAHQGATALTSGRANTIEKAGTRRVLVSIDRFDAAFFAPHASMQHLPQRPALTAAEAAVVRLRIAGLESRHIASLRATATHTVTNQCRCALRKLGVSTRAELLSKLIRAATYGQQRQA